MSHRQHPALLPPPRSHHHLVPDSRQGSSQGCGSESWLFVPLPLLPPYSTLHFLLLPLPCRHKTLQELVLSGVHQCFVHSSLLGHLHLSTPVRGTGPAQAAVTASERPLSWMGTCSTGRAFFHGAVVTLHLLLSPLVLPCPLT